MSNNNFHSDNWLYIMQTFIEQIDNKNSYVSISRDSTRTQIRKDFVFCYTITK